MSSIVSTDILFLVLPPSPPSEKATACQDQAWKASSESVGRRKSPSIITDGPAPCEASPVLIGLLRPQRVERLRHLRGLRVALRLLGRDVSEGASSAGLAWLDRLAIILSVNAWSVVAASVHSRASLRYSSRCWVSSVSSAALTQFSAWYS